MKRMAMAVLMLFGTCGTVRATCQVSSTSLNQPNVLSGSAFVPNSQQVNGGGVGPWVNGADYQITPQFSYDWQTLSGDQTIVAQLTRMSSVAPSSGGILVWSPFGVNGAYVGLYFVFQNGSFYATLAQLTHLNHTYTSTVLAQQAMSSGFYLKFVKTSGSGGFANFSAYYSSDGTNYTLLGTANGVVLDGNLGFGLYAAAGDTTGILKTAWQNVSGLVLPGLTDVDVNEAIPGTSYPAGSAIAGVTAGNLFIGPNPVSGSVLVSGCGTGNSLNVNNQIILTDVTTGQELTNLDQNFLPQVTPCDIGCTFSYLMQPTGGGAFGPYTLTSGHQYKIQNNTADNIPGKVSTPTISQTTYLNP